MQADDRTSSNSGRPLVLILCTGNSCRSQIAEAILRAAADGVIEVASAGSDPAGYVHPLALRVLKEAGYGVEAARSKHLNEFLERPVETVITVCGNADQACPVFPGQVRRYHWGFDDPAKIEGDEDYVLGEFRRVRDEIERVFTAYGRGRADGKRMKDEG